MGQNPYIQNTFQPNIIAFSIHRPCKDHFKGKHKTNTKQAEGIRIFCISTSSTKHRTKKQSHVIINLNSTETFSLRIYLKAVTQFPQLTYEN